MRAVRDRDAHVFIGAGFVAAGTFNAVVCGLYECLYALNSCFVYIIQTVHRRKNSPSLSLPLFVCIYIYIYIIKSAYISLCIHCKHKMYTTDAVNMYMLKVL